MKKAREDDLQQLRAVLQVLALPVIGQIRLVEADCARAKLLAAAFDATHHAVHSQVGRELLPGQARALARLGHQLADLDGEYLAPICSELAMRKSSDWQKVRSLARQALVHFRWTLDVPQQALQPAVHFWGQDIYRSGNN